MNGDEMTLKNSITGDWGTDGMSFHFAVDTCANFATYTGSTTCKTNEVVEPYIDNFDLVTKLSEEFYSAKTFASNNE